MGQKQSLEIQGKPVERVGVIIVHGIGEQKRFEFLEGETRKIVNAIIHNYGARRRDVTPVLKTGTGDSYLGNQSSWASGGLAPLHAMVELPDKIVDIAFHEVWWADINEKLTLGKQFRFWLWGLSLPGIPTRKDRILPGASERTRLPEHAGWLPWYNRWRMAFVSMLFGLSAFSIAFINMILKRLDFSPLLSTDVLVNYLSGVKLYGQDKRAGGSPMDGPDEPPRAAIRRRMIRVMVDVAQRGYDRWYILAHSLGTVVAWNGLMEIERTLPNYLDQECWDALANCPLRAVNPTDFDINAMMPNRPVWVGARDIISRDALFEKFRGVLTYGSPLERFCALWSPMVPINDAEDPFRVGTEWINVYDPTDPVATWVYDFNPKTTTPTRPGHTKLKPHNFPCRSSRILLYSHICYLKNPRTDALDGKDFLVNQAAHWLITGESLADSIKNATRNQTSFWMPSSSARQQTEWDVRWRRRLRAIQDVVVGVALLALTLLSLNYVIYPLAKGTLGLVGASSVSSALSKFLVGWLPNSMGYRVLAETGVLLGITAAVVAGSSWILYVRWTKQHDRFKSHFAKQSALTPHHP